MANAKKKIAVVTGGNKGIGFEICKQLADKIYFVVLTARDEKRGLEAVQKLSSENVVFHQLDVKDPTSIASLADFIKTQYGKLDILVNNAGVSGAIVDGDAFKTRVDAAGGSSGAQVDWSGVMTQPYEVAEACLQTNYYGANRMIEAHIPLLQLSDSPRVVNVSSSMGLLKNIPNEWAKRVLSDKENLTEEKIDQVLNQFLKDFKEGAVESKGWPRFLGAYILSKAAMNAYTRVAAKKFPTICINSVCPGFVKTDLNFNRGILSVEDGAESAVRLALLPDGSSSGRFYVRKDESPF